MQYEIVQPASKRRRRFCLTGLTGLGALAAAGCATDRPPSPSAGPQPASGLAASPSGQVLAFSAMAAGSFPEGWHPYSLRRDVPRTQYLVQDLQGRRVLHAHARASVTGLRCPVQVDPLTHRHLHFSWRVQDAPARGNVAVAEDDDSPARLIVAFGGDETRMPLRDRLFYEQVELFTGQRLPYATLMYVWDGGSNPVETIVRNHRTARIQYLVVDSGASAAGQWRHHRRDVVADYQRAFGEAPGPITSVGVLTDGDATKVDLQAWYGDIRLER